MLPFTSNYLLPFILVNVLSRSFGLTLLLIRFISSLFRYICLYLIRVACNCFLSNLFCMQNFLIRKDANTANLTPWFTILLQFLHFLFFLYIFRGFVYTEYLCCPSEGSTRYCVIPDGYPPQDWWSLPSAGEELDLNPGLLICSQVHYHWATSPPTLSQLSSNIEPTLLFFASRFDLLWSKYEGQHKTSIRRRIKPSLGTLHRYFRQPFLFFIHVILFYFAYISFVFVSLPSLNFKIIYYANFFNSLRGE